MSVDPLFRENPNRFVLFPIKWHGIWDMYKKALASIWTVALDSMPECDG